MLKSSPKIARDVKDLLWVLLQVKKDMPKHLLYSLGVHMQESVDKMLSYVCYTNAAKNPLNRIKYLSLFLAEHNKLELYIEFCVEHQLIKGGLVTQLLKLIVSIGRQAAGWKASIENKY